MFVSTYIPLVGPLCLHVCPAELTSEDDLGERKKNNAYTVRNKILKRNSRWRLGGEEERAKKYFHLRLLCSALLRSVCVGPKTRFFVGGQKCTTLLHQEEVQSSKTTLKDGKGQ